MAEVSFGKQENASPAPVIEVKSETVPAPTTLAVAPTVPVGEVVKGSGLLLGDYLPELKDIILPRVNIVQGIGKLQETFPKGAIVFGQNLVLWEGPKVDAQGVQTKAGSPPVVMTVLGFRPTRFVEKVKGGARGLIVTTEEEVAAHGGTLDYNEWKLKEASGIKRFEPLADAMVAIRRPADIKDDDTTFVYEVEGHKYALALWSMKGVVYTAGAKKVFFTARKIGALRGGYPTYSFYITTRLEKYPGGNAAWIPICLPAEKNTDEFLKFVNGIIGR
jgi:hypothetical protein